jgi:hypothetical protein
MMGFWLNTHEIEYDNRWRAVQSDVDGYIDCVKRCYERTLLDEPEYGPCECDTARGTAWASLTEFNRLARMSRIYALMSWE